MTDLQKPPYPGSCAAIPGTAIEVNTGGFIFCRYGVAILFWVAALFHSITCLWFATLLLAISAIVTVQYAPMILLYRYTIGLLYKGKTTSLGIKGMRFAHSLGTILSICALCAYYLLTPKIGWATVFFIAGMKSISAVGLCPAYKIYYCLTSDGCCSFLKGLK
ncbi:MAG: DUF4395 domain-containing protein [Ignavibacteria bacterium]|nr:DUF4395 domain-containing protein [Ignavibacteria bacterium]